MRGLLGGPALLLGLVVAASAALAQKSDPPGVSDHEIKIGQTMPYSGPASAYGTIGRSELAFFAMINAAGGVNGRKITLLTVDDGLSPPKTVEQTRRLVEQDQVLLMFSTLGTPTSMSVRKYLNSAGVPQLFVASGATAWGDYTHFPWTIGWQPNYQTETHVYAKYILEHRPDARIGVLYQDDDYGKDYLKGLRDALGDRAAKMIVTTASYETTDPTVDSQVVSLESANVDVFFNGGTPKFGAQAIRKAYDIGWHPLQFIASVSTSIGAVLKPAGVEKAKGVISIAFVKDPTDPQWQGDKGYQEWLAFMKRWYPEGDLTDSFNVWGYSLGQTLVEVLRRCGGDLSRQNVMRQAAQLDLSLPMLLPGIRITTAPDDFRPIKAVHLQRFDGTHWVLFGDVIKG
ncbi:MAG TPA: ABC transporter substrate-binding protein [Stellaceae bacterium]|nr:ABC transporter substrate-binding protein [Stellaceae bacterium]